MADAPTDAELIEAYDATYNRMRTFDRHVHALRAVVKKFTPSPPVAAPPATPALSDEQIEAICDQFKTLIRQKREVHLRRGLDAGADYYIGDVANYVGHAVKEAANARIAELVAENEMLSRSLDESLFVDLQCVAERAAAQPQPQPAQPLTGAGQGGMTIVKALRMGLRAEVWLDGGTGPKACVGICAIQLQGWTHTADTAKAWADAYNRAIDNMRAAYAITAPITPTQSEVAP